MDGLAAIVPRSWWAKDEAVHARPGVVDGLVRLRQRFLLCAICRSAPPAAEKTLLELRRRGLRFDLAYALPDEMRHDREAAPCLGAAAERQLCRDFDALQRPVAPDAAAASGGVAAADANAATDAAAHAGDRRHHPGGLSWRTAAC